MKKIAFILFAALLSSLMTFAAPSSRQSSQEPDLAFTNQALEAEFFDVYLKDVGINKIKVVKILRSYLEIDLKVAYELVQEAPIVIKESMPAEKAKELQKELTEVGATVELRTPKPKK